jgi:hypothetical protein
MTVAYGYNLTPAEDPFVTKIHGIVDLFIQEFGTEHAKLIELVPFCESFLDSNNFTDFILPSKIYSDVASWWDVRAPGCTVPRSRS